MRCLQLAESSTCFATAIAIRGYRFYSVKQLTQLNRIIALKDLELTSEQVKSLVKVEISADEIRGMLTLKKSQIEQTIQRLVA